MKILLDECVPRKFKRSLLGHECQTVPEAGFAGKKNGQLLTSAEANQFQAFLTVDQGIEYQQSLQGRTISILILRTKSNQLSDLLPLVENCLESLDTIQPGQLIIIG